MLGGGGARLPHPSPPPPLHLPHTDGLLEAAATGIVSCLSPNSSEVIFLKNPGLSGFFSFKKWVGTVPTYFLKQGIFCLE